MTTPQLHSSYSCVRFNTRDTAWKRDEGRKTRDLWTRLDSSSFTFCSSQISIRGLDRAGPKQDRARMSPSVLDPPAKPARLCGTFSPAWRTKEGLWQRPSPPSPNSSWLYFKFSADPLRLQNHVLSLAALTGFQLITLTEYWPSRKRSAKTDLKPLE